MRRICATLAAVTFLAVADAQTAGTPIPTVTSEGEAYVAAEPKFIDFRLTLTHRSETTSLEAATAAQQFVGKVREELEERSLKPVSIDTPGVQIRRANARQATSSVRLRFNIVRFAGEDERLTAFASLCDDIVALSDTLGCILGGPDLVVENAEATEQQAVARATENALYRADPVASLLQSQIYAVQEVQVLETNWLHDAPTDSEYAPTLAAITCHARVKVVYLISPGA